MDISLINNRCFFGEYKHYASLKVCVEESGLPFYQSPIALNDRIADVAAKFINYLGFVELKSDLDQKRVFVREHDVIKWINDHLCDALEVPIYQNGLVWGFSTNQGEAETCLRRRDYKKAIEIICKDYANRQPNGSTSADQPYLPHLNSTINDLVQKAEQFAEGEEVKLNFIKDILNDGEFQSNPKRYLDDWREQRGTSHICIYPEDSARVFFDHYFKYNEEPKGCAIL
jgi:hypothetical protein